MDRMKMREMIIEEQYRELNKLITDYLHNNNEVIEEILKLETKHQQETTFYNFFYEGVEEIITVYTSTLSDDFLKERGFNTVVDVTQHYLRSKLGLFQLLDMSSDDDDFGLDDSYEPPSYIEEDDDDSYESSY